MPCEFWNLRADAPELQLLEIYPAAVQDGLCTD